VQKCSHSSKLVQIAGCKSKNIDTIIEILNR